MSDRKERLEEINRYLGKALSEFAFVYGYPSLIQIALNEVEDKIADVIDSIKLIIEADDEL